MTYQQLVETPTGTLLIQANEQAVTKLTWAKDLPMGFTESSNPVTEKAAKQLKDYFNNGNYNFEIETDLSQGTPFQQQVWQALRKIPAGTTWSYQQLAEHLNSSPRAIGGAVGANPIPVIYPCHRVVGKQGQLIGFSGGEGVKTKEQLLKHEGAIL